MKSHNFLLCVNDTDSISFSRKDGKPISEKRRAKLLKELNRLMEDGILWEDDDYFKTIIAVAAKNYVLQHCDNPKCESCKGVPKIKGSGLKATKKEPALKKFIKDFIDLLLKDDLEAIPKLYFKYAKRILSIDKDTDISKWCFKITATKKVIEPTTVFNTKIIEGLIDAQVDVIEGDKYYMFFKDDDTLCLREAYDGNINKIKLLQKLFDTAKTFKRVYDIKNLPNLKLKRSQPILHKLQQGAQKRKKRG